jgi:hypothetical protein
VGSVWLNRDGWARDPRQPRPDREIAGLDELTRLLVRAA